MAILEVVSGGEIVQVEIDDAFSTDLHREGWRMGVDGFIRSARYGFRIGNWILDLPDNHVIEHIDGNKLNARQSNLRDLGESWTSDLP